MTEHRAPREAGFTLIEILVAMTVTLIGLAGLLAMHSTSIKSNYSAENTAQATAICERTLEQLRGVSVDQILDDLGAGAWPIDAALTDVDVGPITYRRRLLGGELAADADLVRLRVEVAWTELGAAPGAEGGKYDHRISLELVRTKVDLL